MAAGDFQSAQEYFKKRMEMPSQDVQETYCSIYYLGSAQDQRGLVDAAIDTYFKAYQYRPTRMEPLFRAAILYRKKGNFLLSYLLTQFCLSMPYPKEDNCVEYPIYDHAILIEYAQCALLLGRFKEAFTAYQKLLANSNITEDAKKRFMNNYEISKNN